MAVSQNGYSANDRSVITTYVVTKSGRRLALRTGPPGEMLAHFVRWFDENIRDIDTGILDDWGYAERPIRGSITISNHASGTAADVDATRWPLSVHPEHYLRPEEITRIRAELTRYQGCIRWGGDYSGRKDPMHFEIDRDAATVARVWNDIRLDTDGGDEDMTPEQDDRLKRIERVLGALGGDSLATADTLLFRLRDLTAAMGSHGAEAMRKRGELPAEATVLGIARELLTMRDQLEQMLAALDAQG